MDARLVLPTNKKALANVVNAHCDREASAVAYRALMWRLAHSYLQGQRRFAKLNLTTGDIVGYYTDKNGDLELQVQILLRELDIVTSKITAMDFRPSVTKEGQSLAGIKQRAAAQVIMDAVVPPEAVDRAKMVFGNYLAMYGCAGVMWHLSRLGTKTVASPEIVHPREVYPFPSLDEDLSKQAGIVRQRMVTMEWLKAKYGTRITSNKKDLDYYSTYTGEESADPVRGTGYSANVLNEYYNGGSAYETSDPTKEETEWVRIREVWMYGAKNTVSRYVCVSGEYVIADEDYAKNGLIRFCPLGWARYGDNGTFYGWGLFDMLYGVSRRFELLMRQMVRNIDNMDQYGYVLLPQGTVSRQQVKEKGDGGPRVLFYETDALGLDGFRPTHIQPFSSGDVPGRVASMFQAMIDRLTPVRSLIENKGRVESSSGLAYLEEEINKALATCTQHTANAWGMAYKALASEAVEDLIVNQGTIPVTYLTLDLAGVVIDPKTMRVSFRGATELPVVEDLGFTLRQINPRSTAAMLGSAVDFVEKQASDWSSFLLFCFEQNVSPPMWVRGEQGAYETIVLNTLLIYGDGESPGEAVTSESTAHPELQLRVLTAFMQSPTVNMASPEVQDALTDYQEWLKGRMGNVLPEGIPNPDDYAMLNMAGQPQQVQPEGLTL